MTAIVRGAVLKGLCDRSKDTRIVVSRKSRSSIGTAVNRSWEDGRRQEYKCVILQQIWHFGKTMLMIFELLQILERLSWLLQMLPHTRLLCQEGDTTYISLVVKLLLSNLIERGFDRRKSSRDGYSIPLASWFEKVYSRDCDIREL